MLTNFRFQAIAVFFTLAVFASSPALPKSTEIIDSTNPADREWCAQAANLAFPNNPAAGKLRGQAFVVENAAILGRKLMFRQGKDFFANREIEIYLPKSNDFEGKSFSVSPTDDMFHSFTLVTSLWTPEQMAPNMTNFPKGYGLRLQFGKRRGNLLPGWIVLRLPDQEHSYLQGYFYASPDYVPPGTTKRLGKDSWIKDSAAQPLKR